MKVQSVTAKGALGFPSEHGNVPTLNNTNLPSARTQTGDHGHPRAFVHAMLFALPIIENAHKDPMFWDIQSVTAKGHLDFQADTATFRF